MEYHRVDTMEYNRISNLGLTGLLTGFLSLYKHMSNYSYIRKSKGTTVFHIADAQKREALPKTKCLLYSIAWVKLGFVSIFCLYHYDSYSF